MHYRSESEILAVISEGLSGADIETISLSARRHALLAARNLDLGTIALAIMNTKKWALGDAPKGTAGLRSKTAADSRLTTSVVRTLCSALASPLHARKDLLKKLLAKSGDGIQLNPHMEGDIGSAMFEHACKLGLEGIVSKHRDRAYR